MELRHLRYFAVLARELHFARAAEQLGITQPTLSRTIQHLEKELGVHLFSRENKWNISLTEAGRTLLAETEKILPKLDDAMTRTRAVGSGICGRLLSDICKHCPSLTSTRTAWAISMPAS